MTTTTSPTPELAAPRPRGGVVQSVNDSLVMAKRNLIRMSRIPNPVRGDSIRSESPGSGKERIA
ncbi:hypothetical protein ACFWB1_24325 [Streptomyces goshikiensis]|uniref:hypothetical protein n=1 Tax=Streptomyces goshikiensis TaxID=1942 RepID=UPI00367D6483